MKIRVGDKTILSLNREKPEKKNSDEKIDVVRFLKKHQGMAILTGVILISILSFQIRTLNVNYLGDKVLALDPWVFYRYTLSVVNTGSIPEVDLMRNFPVGYSTHSESVILPYLLGNIYKILKNFIPDLKVVNVMQYYPPVATFFSVIMFYLLGSKFFNKKTGLIAALTLTVAPGFLFRTIAGFADKEALATLFIFSALYFYVSSIKSRTKKKTVFNALCSGIFTGLAGMTWGGFVFPIYSIAGYVIIQVITDNVKDKGLLTQFFWMVPLLISDLFTNRYEILRVLAFDLAVFGFLACLVRIYVYPLIDRKFKDVDKLPPGILSLMIAGVIAVAGAVVILSPGFIINQVKSITILLTDPLGGGGAMGQSVSENQQPYFNPDWISNLGSEYFIFILLGAVLLFHFTLRKVYNNDLELFLKLTLPYALLFLIIVFSRYQIGNELSDFLEHYYQPAYIIFLGWTGLIFISDWKKGKKFNKMDKTSVLLLVWFTLLAIAARGAVRLLFPFVPVAIMVGSYFFVRCYELITNNLKDNFYKYLGLGILSLIFLILVINPFNISVKNLSITSYYSRIMSMAPNFGPSIYGDWDEGFNWIKQNTSEDAVFVHWWDYGYWIQSVANRTTVTDGGNARSDWNYLMGRHLFGGSSLEEVHDVLRELSSPDYFYVVSDDVGKFYQMERIGERNTYYTLLTIERIENNTLQTTNMSEFPNLIIYKPTTNAIAVQEDFNVNGKLFAQGSTYVVNVIVPISNDGRISNPLALVYNTVYGQALLPVNGFCEQNKTCYTIDNSGVPSSFYMIQNGAIWIPQKAGTMFMTHQYLLNKVIPGFELVWESSAPLDDMKTIMTGRQNVRIYKINYTEMENAILEGYSWI